MSREEIDEELSHNPLIKFIEAPVFKDINEVIRFACIDKKATVFSRDNYYQCGAGRNRSLTDLYSLCKNYFPDVTMKDILEVLIKDTDLNGFRCPDIDRYVVSRKQSWQSNNIYSRINIATSETEFNYMTLSALMDIYEVKYS